MKQLERFEKWLDCFSKQQDYFGYCFGVAKFCVLVFSWFLFESFKLFKGYGWLLRGKENIMHEIILLDDISYVEPLRDKKIVCEEVKVLIFMSNKYLKC